MWHSLKRLLAPPTFPDKEKTLAARWLNFLLLTLVALLMADSIGVLLGLLDQDAPTPILFSNIIGIAMIAGFIFLMRCGYVKITAFLFVSILFILITYTNAIVFQSIRTPNIMAYFVLIPLAGPLLGRRNMNILAALCMMTVGIIFYLELIKVLTPSLNTRSIIDDVVVLYFAMGLNTFLSNASIRRVEENTEAIRQTAAALATVNVELQTSQTKLKQAHDELEERVQQKTQDLRLVNMSLQREIEERQRMFDALRTSEAKFRSLVENVPDIIVNINQEGVITFINRTIGERQPENLIGEPATQFHTQVQYQVLLKESMERVFNTGETFSYESEEATEGGMQWKINRLGGIKQDKKVVALILISTDITEQKQTQAAMYQAQKLESLGVMAGGIAHDFNNLLTAMLMQLSSATTKFPADHPVSTHIQRTIKAAERATELTRQMLNYTGRSQAETKPLDINDLITENIHLFSAGIPKNVSLEPSLQSSMPLILGDRGQIQQLIMNLILNGADAIGQKNGTIVVVTEVQEVTANDAQYWKWSGTPLAIGRYVRLEVRDTGSGMDEKTLAKIFDPFFTTKFTGRGLGLASVLGIVRSHKAGLHVSSAVGQGTTFTILFPAIAGPVYSIPEVVTMTTVTLANEMVLVIDDEDMVRETMADILSETGLQVLQAADGPTGIELFCQHVHELKLMFLDLSMPGMSGEMIFYELQAINPTIPILLISGYSEHEIMDRFVNKGLAGFIQKPYTIKSLIQRIEPHLHIKSSGKNGLLSAVR